MQTLLTCYGIVLDLITMTNAFLESGSPLRELNHKRPVDDQGYLVLFGELFNRGYANGLVEEAQQHHYKIIKSTVGRREADQTLRALRDEERPSDCHGFINVPLEAGFDMEKDAQGLSPVDRLKDLSLKNWKDHTWPKGSLQTSLEKGRARFRQSVQAWVKELEKIIPTEKTKVVFAHLMAGGVPRAKIVMPLMNRVFKGTGERHMESTEFWDSTLGELCALSFDEVTANTLDVLIDETRHFRDKVEKAGGHVSYVAYGYHGTEIWIGPGLRWQSYSPYLQGWAKLKLENVAKNWFSKNVKVCVYNCPEILTNSSSIFQGVEVPLYALIRTFQKKFPDVARTHRLVHETTDLLQKPQDLEKVYKMIDEFYSDPEVLSTIKFEEWPSHSRRGQLEKLLKISSDIVDCHKDEKKLMVSLLSEVVFRSCGWGMFHDSYSPEKPVRWIGHDFIALGEVGRN